MDLNTLSELLLVSLYDLAEEQPHSFFFFQLDEIGEKLGATDMNQMVKAVQILESRGFATLSMGSLSALSAMISGDGISFVENGGETGIIKAYRNNPQEIMEMVSREVKATLEPEAVAATGVDTENKSEPSLSDTIDEIFSRIKDILISEPTLSQPVREDALKDLESLKIQVSKNTRNWRLIEVLLDSLAEIPSILIGLKALASVLKNLE